MKFSTPLDIAVRHVKVLVSGNVGSAHRLQTGRARAWWGNFVIATAELPQKNVERKNAQEASTRARWGTTARNCL